MNTKRSKRYRECAKTAPTSKLPLAEAVKVLKGWKHTKFDSTVNLVMHLGIDTKQADQALRGSISLPHGVGATKKVIAFCDGVDIEKAKASGRAVIDQMKAMPTEDALFG